MKSQSVPLFQKLLLEHVDRKFIKVKSHVSYHLFVLLFDLFVGRSWWVDRVNIERVFTQSDCHRISIWNFKRILASLQRITHRRTTICMRICHIPATILGPLSRLFPTRSQRGIVKYRPYIWTLPHLHPRTENLIQAHIATFEMTGSWRMKRLLIIKHLFDYWWSSFYLWNSFESN